jgi:carboxypeptidase C (cathepsin A)
VALCKIRVLVEIGDVDLDDIEAAFDQCAAGVTQFADPILEKIVAATTTSMVDFITRTVGWKDVARYNALSGEVSAPWSNDGEAGEQSQAIEHGSVQELRESLAIDPKLDVLIVHGRDDLSCPFMVSLLIVDQIPVMGDPARVQVRENPGGHMCYSRGARPARATCRRTEDVRDALSVAPCAHSAAAQAFAPAAVSASELPDS